MVATSKDRVDGVITINTPPAHTADIRAAPSDDQDLLIIDDLAPGSPTDSWANGGTEWI